MWRLSRDARPVPPPWHAMVVYLLQHPALLSTAALRLESGRVIARSEYKWMLV